MHSGNACLQGECYPALQERSIVVEHIFDEELHLAISVQGRGRDYYATRTCARQTAAVLHYRYTPCATRSVCAPAHVRPTYRICMHATQCRRLLGILHINGDRCHCGRQASESPTTTALRSHNASGACSVFVDLRVHIDGYVDVDADVMYMRLCAYLSARPSVCPSVRLSVRLSAF